MKKKLLSFACILGAFSGTETNIARGDLQSGIYFCAVETAEGIVATKKLVIN